MTKSLHDYGAFFPLVIFTNNTEHHPDPYTKVLLKVLVREVVSTFRGSFFFYFGTKLKEDREPSR